ncbi:MAG TPA: hypothetical protein VE954_17105 [Oligoflexus sp.]|uniref:hypothetical protein n=1 Tax=Oligoflexus sp. TaxID=1971216 RepID=UPI002D2753D9|nr:hypothetical protein [Oligoflexus sp.]HYX34818.1 hypothetical protein [Oligoflexus sp.]
MAVAALDMFSGQGRSRTKKIPKSNLQSHYQFAFWSFEDGKRIAVPVGGVRSDKRSEYALISTAIKNEGSGTETLVWLHFDLDFKRADKKWVCDGKLDWPRIAATLQADVPELLSYLSYAVRSTSGQGLSLVLAISPLELIDETSEVQRLAFRLQAMIIRILNFYEMGADEGARGLKRLMPNMFRADRVLDQAEFVQQTIQKNRPRVIQKLLYALRFHPAMKPKNKRDRSDILWPDIRVELPCARLYGDLLDTAGPWGTEQRTAQEIISRYGMSKNTVYKLISDPPKWLGVERLTGGEGYRLTIRPTREMTDRAYDLLENGGEGQRKGILPAFSAAAISAPENVCDGGRNQWLVSVVLACKWKGIDRCALHEGLKKLIPLVSGWQRSRTLTRELKSIVRSLYHHRSSRMGSNPDLILPEWLCEALLPAAQKTFSQNFYKKGAEGSHVPTLDLLELPKCPFEVVSTKPVFPPLPSGGWPVGSGGGLGPRRGGDDAGRGSEATGCNAVFLVSTVGRDPQPEPLPEDREPAARNPVLSAESGSDDTFLQLSGSALSGAFSKALMRSALIAAEKVRILTLVTSETDPGIKDQLRRRWLSKLNS